MKIKQAIQKNQSVSIPGGISSGSTLRRTGYKAMTPSQKAVLMRNCLRDAEALNYSLYDLRSKSGVYEKVAPGC